MQVFFDQSDTHAHEKSPPKSGRIKEKVAARVIPTHAFGAEGPPSDQTSELLRVLLASKQKRAASSAPLLGSESPNH